MNPATVLCRSPALTVRARAGKQGPRKATRKIARFALTSKEPSGSDASPAAEGSKSQLNDPLSAMMNFISDVNPLASVFKSPDGSSRERRDESGARGSHITAQDLTTTRPSHLPQTSSTSTSAPGSSAWDSCFPLWSVAE